MPRVNTLSTAFAGILYLKATVVLAAILVSFVLVVGRRGGQRRAGAIRLAFVWFLCHVGHARVEKQLGSIGIEIECRSYPPRGWSSRMGPVGCVYRGSKTGRGRKRSI